MDDLYRDDILEHYRRPHNFGACETPTRHVRGRRTRCAATGSRCCWPSTTGSCARSAFTGRGCAISQASASLLTDEVKGKPVADVAALEATDAARPAGHRHQPGAAQVRPALARHAPARCWTRSARKPLAKRPRLTGGHS